MEYRLLVILDYLSVINLGADIVATNDMVLAADIGAVYDIDLVADFDTASVIDPRRQQHCPRHRPWAYIVAANVIDIGADTGAVHDIDLFAWVHEFKVELTLEAKVAPSEALNQ